MVTLTVTGPALPGGATAVIWVSESTRNVDAATEPNLTPVAPMKPVPVITTSFPPAAGPVFGNSPDTREGLTPWQWLTLPAISVASKDQTSGSASSVRVAVTGTGFV